MDYDKIIELYASDEKTRLEIEERLKPEPDKPAESYFPLIEQDLSTWVRDDVVRHRLVPNPEQYPELDKYDLADDVRDDPLFVHTRQEKINNWIGKLEVSQPGDIEAPYFADELMKEVSRYEATEVKHLWPTVEKEVTDQGSALARKGIQRVYEISELTSDAVDGLQAGVPLPASYGEQIHRLFTEEQEDIYTIVEPKLNRDVLDTLKSKTLRLYPAEPERATANDDEAPIRWTRSRRIPLSSDDR